MADPPCDNISSSLFNRLWCLGKHLEDFLLAALLTVMIMLAVLLIVLRNVFDSGLVWGDELLRILVLWLCLVGSMAASRDENHLSIDVFSRFLPQRLQVYTRILTSLFTAVICILIAGYAWKFVRIEAEFGSTVLGNWPAWIAQGILPFGFGLIAYRYTLQTGRKIVQLVRHTRSTP